MLRSLVLCLVALVGVVAAQNITIPFNFPLFKQVKYFVYFACFSDNFNGRTRG